MKRYRHIIYHSWIHVVLTILVILIPFIFILIFSQYAKISTEKLFSDLFISLVRLIISYIIALLIAWVCAVAFYKGKRALIALPIFDVLQSFPSFAALPLAVYFLGSSTVTIIIFLTWAIIWPIFFSLLSSLKLVRNDLEEAATVARLKGVDYLRWFLLPVSLPGLITGSIIGLGEGWEALVATEIIVNAKTGLASFFLLYSQNTLITVFGIIGFLLLIFTINKLIWLPLLEYSHRLMEE